tara:strand:+ start:149 stop:499 length:351 start_codon:yes stop_codon:yes gene_type:complete
MITIYGLKKCDTCRKALKWLTAEGIVHEFKDLRADGFSDEQLRTWINEVGWETLLNRRGTTWRKLPETDKDGVDEAKAASLMRKQPALIKRPVFETGSGIVVSFKADEMEALKAAS